MKIIWNSDLTSETLRILNVAYSIKSYFFQINGYFVLPNFPIKISNFNKSRIILFPDLYYSKQFWKNLREFNLEDIEKIIIFKNLVSEIGNTTSNLELKNDILASFKPLWKHNQKLIPVSKNVKNVTVSFTNWGSNGSFTEVEINQGRLHIFLRNDANLWTFWELVLSSLTRINLTQNLNSTWSESEMVVDWLLTHSYYENLISKFTKTQYVPTVKGLRQIQTNIKIIKQSQKFLEKLGFGMTSSSDLKIHDGELYYFKKQIYGLNIKEIDVLNFLIINRRVSYDQIGELIWESPENFSLQALAKYISRLRKTLLLNGVPKELIQTVNGWGYVVS